MQHEFNCVAIAVGELGPLCSFMDRESFWRNCARSFSRPSPQATISRMCCSASLCCNVAQCEMLLCAVSCCAVRHCTALCCAVLHCSVLCCAVLRCAVLRCAVLRRATSERHRVLRAILASSRAQERSELASRCCEAEQHRKASSLLCSASAWVSCSLSS